MSYNEDKLPEVPRYNKNGVHNLFSLSLCEFQNSDPKFLPSMDPMPFSHPHTALVIKY